MNQEIQTIALQWLKRILFPDFTNKLTWVVALAGIALVGVPNEILVAILNWFVSFANQRQLTQPPLPHIGFTADPMGYWLIFGALAHNLINKAIALRLNSLEMQKQRERREMDRQLFASLIELLPSNGMAINLARDHDFGNSFAIVAMGPINEFHHTWDNAEHEFLDKAIEAKKCELLTLAGDFALKVATHTGPSKGGMQTAIPSGINVDFGFPDYLKQEIRELNEAASAFYRAHQAFVRYARENL